MIKKVLSSLFVFAVLGVKAQNNTGAIKVTIKDKTTGETLPFASVVAYAKGVQVAGTTTDMNGECFLKPLPPGTYDVKAVYVGYQPKELKGILVGEGKTAYVTLLMETGEGIKLDEVVVETYQVPLVDPDTKSGGTVTREEYNNMATKDINTAAASNAGIFQADEGRSLNVRGGRNTQNTYFVDGVKVIGGLALPQQAVEQINVITGGVPAMYGDVTSGVVSVSTRGPQSKFFGGIEFYSSGLGENNKGKIFGLDPYGFNSLGFSIGGPIWNKIDTNGNKKTIVGYFLAGQGNYVKDPIPSFVPVYVLKDDVKQDLINTPLQPSPSGSGFVKRYDYVTMDQLQKRKSHVNVASYYLALNGKIDVKPAENTNISIGGAYELNNGRNFSFSRSLFTPESNSQTISKTWRASLRVTQKFGKHLTSTEEKEKSSQLLTNTFFNILASYEGVDVVTQDPKFKDKFFDYGYIGKFNQKYSGKDDINNYVFNPKFVIGNDTIKAYEYQGPSPIGFDFTPGNQNPEGVAFTQYVLANIPFVLPTLDFLPAFGGMRNGDNGGGAFAGGGTVYGMWTFPGIVYSGYSKVNYRQFRVAASINTDLNINHSTHAITAGFEFDQREQRGWSVNPTGLWSRMRQIVNQHITQLDKSRPIYNPDLSYTYPAYYYDNLYVPSQQTEFSIKLLQALGKPINTTEQINIDALDPSVFSIDMFSAEDLLGNSSGNALVDYFGYDHTGKRYNGSTNLSEFLTKTDEYGKKTYLAGAFRPIYMAGYIQDRFDYRDLKFNVGIRVDRYDANQKVLKDPYLVHPAKTVGETRGEFNHPGNMGDNYVVYTTDINGGSVIGYRNGDKWYDAQGNEVSDPNALAGVTGKLTPYLKNPQDFQSGQPFSPDAFTNYKAQINVMPRIAFSFPISDMANFSAHYDILTKRPGSTTFDGGNRFDPKDYYFLPNESSLPFLTNPNLRPEKTVDYSLGFAQILNERKNSVLKIELFYRELRDMLTLRNIVGAFPKNYLTYVNQDFGTVKGLTLEFDLRRTGGSSLKANYTLQFAEGSGSNANSGANLALSGQPNLRVLQPLDYDQRHTIVLTYDYRFGKGSDYKGPKWTRTKNGEEKTIQIFKDVGFNIQFFIGSGTPYTRWAYPVPANGSQRASIVGAVNGSYKPWTIRGNLRIDKNFELTFGKKDSDNQRKANLNVYLQVLNVLNQKNILGVYNFTGLPDDDGFLSSPIAQSTIQLTNSPAAFVDQYRIFINRPFNYSLPRQIRLGIQLDF